MNRRTSARSASPTASRRNGDLLKPTTLAILVLLSAFALAGANPNPADYTINVHVSKSRTVGAQQRLNVVISGKKFRLEGTGPAYMLLALGDYKAKLAKDEHKGTGDSLQIYEFLLPGQKTRRFWVVGQTE
jgi:hypothetical protein